MTGGAWRRRLVAVLAPTLVLPFLASLFYFVLWSDRPIAQVVYTGTKVFTVVWPFVAVRYLLHTPFLTAERNRKRFLASIPLGLLVGVAMVVPMFLVLQTPLGDLATGAAGRIRVKAQQLGILDSYWTFGLFLSVIHSFIEEYYWRWFAFGQLTRLVTRPLAHLIAGVAFGAHHVVVATQFFPLPWGVLFGGFVGLAGVIWSVQYERQGTVGGVWAAHLVVDLGIMAIGHRLLFGTYW